VNCLALTDEGWTLLLVDWQPIHQEQARGTSHYAFSFWKRQVHQMRKYIGLESSKWKTLEADLTVHPPGLLSVSLPHIQHWALRIALFLRLGGILLLPRLLRQIRQLANTLLASSLSDPDTNMFGAGNEKGHLPI
jgi:hypothetical protein